MKRLKADFKEYVGAAKYRYFEIPASIFDDNRLDPIDVRAYGILFDVERGGEARISLARIGQRIGRTDRAAERSIARLESAGWLKTVEDTNGRCRKYRLTPVIGEQGTASKPPAPVNRVTKQTPATDGQGLEQTPVTGDSQPCTPVTKTLYTGEHLSNCSLSVFLDDDVSKKTEDGNARHRLLETSTACPSNGNGTGPRRLSDLYADILAKKAV